MTPLIDGDLNIPDNCALVGSKAILGRSFGAPNLNLFKPRLILNRSATITLNNSSEIRQLGIFAKNLTFSDTSAHVNAWTGTAISLADLKADQLVEDCFIIGFAYAVSSAGVTRIDRPRVKRCFIDCVNGVYLTNVYDVPYITDCHGYPWATLESTPEAGNAHLKRNGSFVQLDGTANDWCKITDCFNFGWKYGFRITGADSVTLMSCSADNDPGTADGSIGFLIEGTSLEARLIGCQSAGRQEGIKIATTDINGRVFIADTVVWASYDHSIHVINGDVNIVNCGLRATMGNGLYFENTGTRAKLIGCRLNGFAIALKTDSTGAKVAHTQCTFDGCTTIANNPYLAGIAAANPLVLDAEATMFQVAGNTNFDTVSNVAAYAGKIVTLKFTGTPTVADATGNLKLNGNFVATADDTLSLLSDGAAWFELARSAN
jgi:hypothetical protein